MKYQTFIDFVPFGSSFEDTFGIYKKAVPLKISIAYLILITDALVINSN